MLCGVLTVVLVGSGEGATVNANRSATLSAIADGDWVLTDCAVLLHKDDFEKAGWFVQDAVCTSDASKDFELFKLKWDLAVRRLVDQKLWTLAAGPWTSWEVGTKTHYGRTYADTAGKTSVAVRFVNGNAEWYVLSKRFPALTADLIFSHARRLLIKGLGATSVDDCPATTTKTLLRERGYEPTASTCSETAAGGTIGGQVFLWNTWTTVLDPLWPFGEKKGDFTAGPNGAQSAFYQRGETGFMVSVVTTEKSYHYELVVGSKPPSRSKPRQAGVENPAASPR